MSASDYRAYVDAIAALATHDDRLSADREALLVARQRTLHEAAAVQQKSDRAVAEIRQTLIDTERRAAGFQRRFPTQEVPARPAPPTLDDYPAALRELARELDKVESADGWLQRAEGQLADARTRVATAPAVTATGSPTEVPRPAGKDPRPGSVFARFWWAFAAGGAALIAAGVVVGSVLGR